MQAISCFLIRIVKLVIIVDDLIGDYEKISVENTKIGAIGPRFIDENKGFYFPALRFNKYGLIDKISVENIQEPIEVSFLIFSGTLVSVAALEEIGNMKEELLTMSIQSGVLELK